MSGHQIWNAIILLSCLLITGCTPLSRQQPTYTPGAEESPPDDSNDQLAVLFNQCETPCWMGILPGQTTGDDAVKLLGKHYGQENIETDRSNFVQWISNGVDISESGYMGLLDNVVSDVYILVPENKLSAGDLIQLLGEPDLVFAADAFTSDGKCLRASLFYSKQGVEASLYPFSDSVGVQKEQFISRLSFLSPKLAVWWEPTESIIINWDGFRDYCKR